MEMRELLKQLMAANGDDAYSLEIVSGVPQPTTNRFLNAKHGDPRSSTVKKWAAAYGITESQLRGDVPLPPGRLPGIAHNSEVDEPAPIPGTDDRADLAAQALEVARLWLSLSESDRGRILHLVQSAASHMQAEETDLPPDPPLPENDNQLQTGGRKAKIFRPKVGGQKKSPKPSQGEG